MSTAKWEWLEDDQTLLLSGSWTVRELIGSSLAVPNEKTQKKSLTIDCGGVTHLDSAGALELVKCCRAMGFTVKTVVWRSLQSKQRILLDMVAHDWAPKQPAERRKRHIFRVIGYSFLKKIKELTSFLGFLGEVVLIFFQVLTGRLQFHWALVAQNIEQTGFRAMGIVALLPFLIGVVLAYEIAMMLSKYGASIYVVELTGIIILREFGPIIAAIIVAGRTATAFAAEIGTMKVREEIDALSALGIEPIERLVLPKLVGLMIALPLLTMLADIAGVFGSMVMAKLQAGITFHSFITRFQGEVSITQLWIGLLKTPIFAFLIALVGTYHGFSTELSAQSVGSKTTQAAVQSIFLVIVVDAVFSVIFSLFGV